MSDQIVDLPVESVTAGDNDRQDFDAIALADLADSIRKNGLAQPITVRPLGGTPMLQVVAGERRLRAVRDVLQWPTVPAIVREMSDEQASMVMLIENLQRADLNPIEEARAYRKRIDQFAWSVDSVAQTAGVSAELVRSRLALLSLVDEVQHLVARGQMPVGHAGALAELDANRQRIALRVYRQSKNMPLADFRTVVGSLLREQSQEALFDLESFWVAQVQAQVPLRGKDATVQVPQRADLPTPQTRPTDSTASVIERYIVDLLAAGHRPEAEAIGTLYAALVRSNFLKLPKATGLALAAI